MSRQKPHIPRHRDPCALPTETSSSSFWHSQPSALLTGHRSTRDLPPTADIVIIGSGITGTSVAYNLFTDEACNTDKHRNVVMLEAREACWGATGRNGGHCLPMVLEHPHDPSIGNFELANYRTIESLVAEKNIDCEFVAQTGVKAIYDHRTLTDTELALMTMQQSDPSLAKMVRLVTNRAELEELRIPTAVGALVTNTAAKLWPYKFVTRILEDLLTATDLNGTFNLQTLTPVQSVSQSDEGRWTVHTSRGSIVASKVVLATNAYTSHLLPSFAGLIVPCRGQMSALDPLPSVLGPNRLKSNFGFEGDGMDDYLVQRPNEGGGQLMFGGGRQHGRSMGVTDDSEVDEATARYLRSRLVEAFDLPEGKAAEGLETVRCMCCRPGAPQKRHGRWSFKQKPCSSKPAKASGKNDPFALEKQREFSASHEWTGIMGFSRDNLPWVGEIPEKKNLYIAAGFTGHGMPNTWLSGKAVALMVAESGCRGIYSPKEQWALPEAYDVTPERIARAMEFEDVEARDWAETERGRRRREGDRPHSGYA